MKRGWTLTLMVLLMTLAGACDAGGAVGTPTPTAPPLYQGQLAFSSNEDGHYEIWLVNSDGSGLRQLTDGGISERHGPAWSPDGTRLAFYAQNRVPYSAIPEDIMILQVDHPEAGYTFVTHTPPIVDRDPAWSPDGQTIAFCADFKLLLIGVDGSNPRILPLRDDYRYYMPAWSPDGARLAVAVQLSNTDYGIFVVNVDGSNLTRLTQGIFAHLDPAWSPDGTTILFASQVDNQIHAIPAPPPTGLQELPPTTKLTTVGVNTEPAWSPDGTTIAFVHTEGQHRDIWVMYKDGAGARPVTRHEGEDLSPAWRPR